MLKKLFFVSFMMGSVVVPYVLSTSSVMTSLKSRLTADESKAAPAAAGGEAAPGVPATTPAPGAAGQLVNASFQPSNKPQKIEGAGAQDLNEVLNFDGTPAWVMARWPRVTAGLAELDLQGYRVPLVTGTKQDDLAGSLTYYFDKEQRIKYISFHGTTGDPRKLIALVTTRYKFRPQETNDPGLSLFLVKWNGKPVSELTIRTARVVRADQPNVRYQVDLAMQRP